MKWRLVIVFEFVISLLLPILPAKPALAASDSPKIVINEIKLGGDSYSQGPDQPKDPQEYVTLYNASDNDVSLDGWLLEYAKPTFNKTYCGETSWVSHSISGSASSTKLSGMLPAGEVSQPIVRSLTDNTTGALHLVDATDSSNSAVTDLVGWGTTAPCSETSAAATPTNGKSLKRYLDCETDYPIDTDDNSDDFAASQPPSPGTLGNPYASTCKSDSTTATQPTGSTTCEGMLISELLPNPAGTDTGKEYIELSNPTQSPIPLAGCSLQTSAGEKVYNFNNVALNPGEFRAFYSLETGLTLANAAGGTVWLLSPTTELQSVTYPANLDDDVAWALVGSTWTATYQATPNADNILLDSKPCPAGQERSADTGRCRNSLTLSTSNLGPCPVGQTRNPDTNRCRSLTSASTSSSLTPCKAGQERNPATNRCRSVLSAGTSLKDCPAGQIRNPTTHRCRKSTSVASIGNVKDIKTATVPSDSTKWVVVGGSLLAALAFAVYEWRQEIMLKYLDIKAKFVRTKAA